MSAAAKPEYDTKGAMHANWRGTTRRALGFVRPLTATDRNAKRVPGPWARLVDLQLSIVARDETPNALEELCAGHDRAKLLLIQHAAATGGEEVRERALALWAALRPQDGVA